MLNTDTCLVVFQQFIGTGRLLGRLLQDYGIPFLYFTGHMTTDQRSIARVIFDEDESVKVLVGQSSSPSAPGSHAYFAPR